MATYKREIVVLKYSYGYYKDRGVFAIFILVSVPIGFVTGGLSGSPWRTFECWSGLTKSPVWHEQFKKPKIGQNSYLTFSIRNLAMSANLGIDWLQYSNRLYAANWLGSFLLCLVPVLYNTCFHCTNHSFF